MADTFGFRFNGGFQHIRVNAFGKHYTLRVAAGGVIQLAGQFGLDVYKRQPENPEQRVTFSLQSPLMGTAPKNPIAVMSEQRQTTLVNNQINIKMATKSSIHIKPCNVKSSGAHKDVYKRQQYHHADLFQDGSTADVRGRGQDNPETQGSVRRFKIRDIQGERLLRGALTAPYILGGSQ